MWKKKSREIEPKKKKLVNSRQTCTHAAHARVTPTSLSSSHSTSSLLQQDLSL